MSVWIGDDVPSPCAAGAAHAFSSLKVPNRVPKLDVVNADFSVVCVHYVLLNAEYNAKSGMHGDVFGIDAESEIAASNPSLREYISEQNAYGEAINANGNVIFPT
jgi:hypothetical protein